MFQETNGSQRVFNPDHVNVLKGDKGRRRKTNPTVWCTRNSPVTTGWIPVEPNKRLSHNEKLGQRISPPPVEVIFQPDLFTEIVGIRARSQRELGVPTLTLQGRRTEPPFRSRSLELGVPKPRGDNPWRRCTNHSLPYTRVRVLCSPVRSNYIQIPLPLRVGQRLRTQGVL